MDDFEDSNPYNPLSLAADHSFCIYWKGVFWFDNGTVCPVYTHRDHI